MPKVISLRQGLFSILFWSIVAAAFIGPGTVTTASKAGASFQMALLWALVFSIIATIILQEAAARITIASGKSLGEIIALKYKGGNNSRVKWIVFLAVAFGCAAYQAGNMLGAISGLSLFTQIPKELGTLLLAIVCGGLLWIGNFKTIANLLGLIVAVMGLAFIYVAFNATTPLNTIASGLIPSIPNGSLLLIIGLIGTTIVPYNLFLASGISKGQNVSEMRLGITIAVLIGGLISIAIMIVGTQVSGTFSFEALGNAMAANTGAWANAFFGFGLFAAGMSSSITSPLAAAVTAQSLLGSNEEKWSNQSRNFRLVWGTILGIGLLLGITGIKPIPAIILAQAINGVLLPVVAIFLVLAVNDKEIMPAAYANSIISNILMLLIVGVAIFLGLNNIWAAIGKMIPTLASSSNLPMLVNAGLSLLCVIALGKKILA